MKITNKANEEMTKNKKMIDKYFHRYKTMR